MPPYRYRPCIVSCISQSTTALVSPVRSNTSICRCALVPSAAIFVDGVHVPTGPEVIERLGAELHELLHQLGEGPLGAHAEVDQLAARPVAQRAPLVLLDERAVIAAPRRVAPVHQVELGHQRLDQRHHRDRVLHVGGHVADADLHRVVHVVAADVPPDALPVVDAPGLDEHLGEGLELLVALELVRDAGPGEALEDLRAVAHQPRVAPLPERRAAGQREQVRQEVADLVAQGDRHLLLLDAHVHVQAEDQVGARHVLEIVDDPLVALHVRDLLQLPVAEGVRGGRHHPQAAAAREAIQLAAHLHQLALHLPHVLADRGSDLDHRLVELRTHPLAQDRLAPLDDLADVAAELPRLGIDDLVLLLDSQRELPIQHGVH